MGVEKSKFVNKGMKNFQSISDNLQDYGYRLAISRLRDQFGFSIFMNKNLIDVKDPKDKFMKIFHKYIKDFDEKYRVSSGEIIDDFMTIVKIDSKTYMYIASGIYMPNTKEYAMLEKSSSFDLYMYIFGKKSYIYYKAIINLIKKADQKRKAHSLYVVSDTRMGTGSYNVTLLDFKPRDIDGLIYSNDEANTISRFVEKFLGDVHYYQDKGLNYKTGVLLYGEPGTGKSSIVNAIASKYDRSICQINIGTIEKIDFSNLTSMINCDTEKYIVLLEDIDTLYLKRDLKEEVEDDGKGGTKKNYNDIINELLQFLDSNSSPNDVIFIATTNHYDRLDKALIREGRFDLKVEIRGLFKKDVPKLINKLDCKASLDQVLEKYGEPDERGYYNQSKLQNIIISLREE